MSSSTAYLNLYKSASDGSEDVVVEQDLNGNWDKLDTNLLAKPRGVLGGRAITGSNNLGSAIGATETQPTSMNSGSQSLAANRRFRIRCRFKASASAANESFVLYIKEDTASTGVTGNKIRELVVQTNDVGTRDFFAEFETTSALTRFFKLTCARITGAGTLQFTGGGTGSESLVGFEVEDIGVNGLLTVTAS